jgi:uncharacterized membrane protein
MATRNHETGDEEPSSDRASGRSRSRSNRNRSKRAVSGVVGAALLVRGLRRRSLTGIATAIAGGWLAYRSIRGSGRRARSSGWSSRTGTGTDQQRGEAELADVERTSTIDASAEELYETWRDPDQLERIVGHVGEVTSVGGDRLRWSVDAPRGRTISWETHVVDEEPGEYVRWRTPEDAKVPNEGTIRFSPAPGNRGTEVTLSVHFDPPGGAIGTAALKRLDVVPGVLVGTALRRFKSLVETGEVPSLEANPSARGKGDLA